MMNDSDRLKIIIVNVLQKFAFILQTDEKCKPSPSKWSKKAIQAYSTDSRFINTCRPAVTQYKSHQIFVYRQCERVEYQQANTAGPVVFWRLMNIPFARTINPIPSHKLQYVCISGKLHVPV